jgi:peptidoglycan/LPS O-acetylase OafA/YrhL
MSRSAADHGCRLPGPAETPRTETPAAFHLGYRPWLDGLRGVAILAVLAYHLQFLPGGFLGVDVFFVLSGFLITTLLIEEWQRHGSISLKCFYFRRILRLWPALFTLLLACGLGALLFQSADAARALGKEILVTACYVANWPSLHGVRMSMLGHTWSLSVEEQFYLIWPLLLYGMLRSGLGRRGIIFWVCVGIVGSASLRAVLYRQHPGSDPAWVANVYRLYMGLDTRADSLLVGCLAGLLVAWRLLPRSRSFLFGISVAALGSAAALGYMCLHTIHAHHQLYCGLFTGVALMVAFILIRQVSAPSRLASLLLESRPLVGVGRISYALYLFHIPIIFWLQPVGLGWRFPAETFLVVGLTFTAAVCSWYCIEQPCLRLKERLSASGSPPKGSTSAEGRPSQRPPVSGLTPAASLHAFRQALTGACAALTGDDLQRYPEANAVVPADQVLAELEQVQWHADEKRV